MKTYHDLINDAIGTAFEWGEWGRDDDEDADTVWTRQKVAKDALRAHVEDLLATLELAQVWIRNAPKGKGSDTLRIVNAALTAARGHP